MKNKLVVLAFLMLAAIAVTCKKPKVKLSDPNQADSLLANTPKTRAGVENLLINAYGLLDGTYTGQPTATWTTGTDNWMYGSVAGGDAYRGSNITDQGDAFALNNYIETPDNTWLDPKWQTTMQGIYYSNTVLKQLPLVKDGSLSAAEMAEVTAEARFLRGFFELELAKIWHNVPYIDETVAYDKGYKNITNTGAIWDKIEGDFSAAMAALPATQASIGRANKYAAEAFLAKTFMFDHKYTQAQPLLADLITNGVTSSGAKYALGRYADNFNPSTKNGPEGVFVIQAYVHDGTQGQNGNAGN